MRNKQKPSSSSNRAFDAQEHVSTTEPEPRSGLQDTLFTGTSRSLQVTHLGTSGNKRRAGGSKCGGAGELSRKWVDLRGAEGERVRAYQGEKAPVFICLI